MLTCERLMLRMYLHRLQLQQEIQQSVQPFTQLLCEAHRRGGGLLWDRGANTVVQEMRGLSHGLPMLWIRGVYRLGVLWHCAPHLYLRPTTVSQNILPCWLQVLNKV